MTPSPASATQLRLQLDGFEGPLELLLSLIEQQRLPITQVSLAQVADQYLQYVYSQPSLDPDLLADFLHIGGKLLLLKSRALLLTEEPDPIVEEAASDLEQRLVAYRVFRAAATRLQELEARGERSHPTQREPLANTDPPPLAPLAPGALVQVWRRLGRAPAIVPPYEIGVLPRASVEERRALILRALEAQPVLSFRDIAGSSVDEVVAAFLAVLELFRRGLVVIEQATQFADVTIARPAGSPAT